MFRLPAKNYFFFSISRLILWSLDLKKPPHMLDPNHHPPSLETGLKCDSKNTLEVLWKTTVYGQSCWNKLSVPRLDRVIVSGGRWWTSIADAIRDETNHLKRFGWKRPEMEVVWHIFHSTGEEPGKMSANCVVALMAVHSCDSQQALIHSYLEFYFVKHFFSAQTADSIHAIFVSWWPFKVKFWPAPHWFRGGSGLVSQK